MLVSEARNPLVVSDKLIQDSPVFPSITITKRASPVKMYKLPAPSKIFAIKFNYLQTLYHTKVLKVDRDYGDPFYKVALSSSISKNASICWLQQEQQGWSMLLGPELDERLKQAITSAIECHEELNNLNEFIMEQELYHYKLSTP